MEAIIARPKADAKRSPARDKGETPAAQPTADDNDSRSPNSDEMTVAKEACAQLNACYDAHCCSMTIHGAELLRHSAECTGVGIPGAIGVMRIGDAFLHAASLVAGVIAIERANNQHHPVLVELEPIADVLSTAGLSFGFEMEPCEGLAAGLRAGIKTFRDRPTPPIRRVEEQAAEKTYAQLVRVLQFVAEQAGNANDILMMMQATPNLGHNACTLLNAAQAITKYLGAAADDVLGGDICGDFEHWTYGPNFASAGQGASS